SLWNGLWADFWSIPHVRLYLAIGWAGYLLGLGIWIVLQKREPAATISWLVSLAALPVVGFLVYYVFGPQKIERHRARRRRHRAVLPRGAGDDETQELHTLAQATTGLA